MQITNIQMPKGCRFMSKDKSLLSKLPGSGKYIINKGITGCGGTTLFLVSKRPLVLISPRKNVLISKNKQYPDTILFRNDSEKDVVESKGNLKKNLIDWNFFNKKKDVKILVTIDSFKHVAQILSELKLEDEFTFLVDEFQNLLSDSQFKGRTDFEFLKILNERAKNIVYLSATPISQEYLEVIPYFKGVPQYVLKWDPGIMETANIREVEIKRPNTIISIVGEYIDRYINEGYFMRKIVNGKEVRSDEIVFFLNEVKTILDIINTYGLKPSETTILISEKNDYVKDKKGNKFKIGELTTEKENPHNKTFTFCTKASFEGVDFYSTSACSVIFIDGNREWMSLDYATDVPQILGRQRLQKNPFRKDVVIYYKSNYSQKSLQEFKDSIDRKMLKSEILKKNIDKMDAEGKAVLANNFFRPKPELSLYEGQYVDVFDDIDGMDFEINYLAYCAELDLWKRQNLYYTNSNTIVNKIETGIAKSVSAKPQHLLDFERKFYETNSFEKRMRLYVDYLERHQGDRDFLHQNPHIDLRFHYYYDTIGVDKIRKLQCKEKSLEDEYNLLKLKGEGTISDWCDTFIEKGKFYSNEEIKTMLEEIYDVLGIKTTPTANDIEKYMEVKKQRDQKGNHGYLVLP